MRWSIISALIGCYLWSLRLYPAAFRAEFGDEMANVFSEALAEAQKKGSVPVLILFLRELRDLPASLWREQRRHRQEQRRIVTMTNDINEADYWRPATGVETAVTILPFMLFSILTTIKAFDYARGADGVSFNWHVSLYLVALAGMGIGWVKGFPRWSLGYLGLALVYSWWLHGLATFGFKLFGYPIDRWEWRGWTALLAVALVATLISRSLSPLVDLAKSIWIDWSRLSFILYAALSWLMLGMIYDNKTWTDPVEILPLLVFSAALFIVFGVLPYLHLHLPWQRGLALQGAFNLAWLSSIAIGAVVSGRADVAWPLLAVWFVFLLLPGILGIMRRASSSPGLA